MQYAASAPHLSSREGPLIVARKMTAVGFEPTQLALVELESTPLDHSGKLSSVAGVPICFLTAIQILGKDACGDHMNSKQQSCGE